MGFLKYLRQAKVLLNEYEFEQSKICNVQSQLTRLIEKNYYLNKSGREAFRAYLLAYASHALKDIFDVHELDLQVILPYYHIFLRTLTPGSKDRSYARSPICSRLLFVCTQGVATGFGFAVPPRVDLTFSPKGRKKNKALSAKVSSGHAFSAENPYGKRSTSDQRQFTH